MRLILYPPSLPDGVAVEMATFGALSPEASKRILHFGRQSETAQRYYRLRRRKTLAVDRS